MARSCRRLRSLVRAAFAAGILRGTIVFPRDANALMNYGLLAHRQGHEDEALDSWRRAVEIDPQQSNAQLYLAQFLDQGDEAQAAARHYRAYLKIVAAHQNDHRSETFVVLAVLVKVADADAAVNHVAEAMQGYQAAIQFAEKSGEKTIESWHSFISSTYKKNRVTLLQPRNPTSAL